MLAAKLVSGLARLFPMFFSLYREPSRSDWLNNNCAKELRMEIENIVAKLSKRFVLNSGCKSFEAAWVLHWNFTFGKECLLLHSTRISSALAGSA
jgi:hypothetical protein